MNKDKLPVLANTLLCYEHLGEIRPCPFCGNPDVTPAEWWPGEPRFSILCNQCGAIGPWHLEIKAAVKSWNVRLLSDMQVESLANQVQFLKTSSAEPENPKTP